MEAINKRKFQPVIFNQPRKGLGGKPTIRRVPEGTPINLNSHLILMVKGDNEPFLVGPKLADNYLSDIANFRKSGGDPSRHRRIRDKIRIASPEELEWFIDQIQGTGKVPNKLASGVERKAANIVDLQARRIAELEAKLMEQDGHPIEDVPGLPIQEMPETIQEPEPDFETETTNYPEGFFPPFPNPQNAGQKGSNTRALNAFKKRMEEKDA